MLDERTRHARALFESIAPAYEWPAELLSLGQYGRWRRALVRSLDLPSTARVLDVATGTGLIARTIRDRYGCAVIGIDQSLGMLAHVRTRDSQLSLTAADANRLPFQDQWFDAVVFSYLLRYVRDPEATLRELARMVRPGGLLASVEFGVPRSRAPRVGWRVWAGGVMPRVSRVFPGGWPAVGEFLPVSITAWMDEWPIERQVRAWNAAGLDDVRVREMTLGTAVLMRGRRRSDGA